MAIIHLNKFIFIFSVNSYSHLLYKTRRNSIIFSFFDLEASYTWCKFIEIYTDDL